MTGRIRLRTAGSTRTVALDDYLDPHSEELAHRSSEEWIKGLRHLSVDGQPLRDRFTVRGDSLWWFAELYLHKHRVILDLHRTIAAVEAMIDRERPLAVSVDSGPTLVRHVARSLARALGVASEPPPRRFVWWRRLALLDLRARRFHLLARVAPRSSQISSHSSIDVAAFVHRAFWTGGPGARGDEPYVGGVLRELEHRLGRQRVEYVGIGPTTNFRARRRWGRSSSVIPVEQYARRADLQASMEVWHARHTYFRALTRSESVQRLALIRSVDCWPLVREELAGIAWLQWPWSVRAMDEAAAALDVLRPRLVFTYAEAGGWGRALVLEARRRGIPSVGLQHGFIYRHWLNYLHEPDEMRAGLTGAFPIPTRTLVFDEFTARHLRDHGRFPHDAVEVTGSPHRDELIRAMTMLTPAAIQETRARTGAGPDDMIVLLTTKEREARRILPPLMAAVRNIPRAWLVIKPHPAETAGVYDVYVKGGDRVSVLEPEDALAPLLGICRAVVTVNSTVAIDAAAAGIPGLVVGLPNNLSPLVETGQLTGVSSVDEIRPALHRILYDESFRQQLMARQGVAASGAVAEAPARQATAASADAILNLL